MNKAVKKLADKDITLARPDLSPRLEKDIQREVCDWLDAAGHFFWRNNTIPVFDKGRFRALPKYTPRGLPDIIVLSAGRFVGLEVKRPARAGHPGEAKTGTNPETTAAQEEMARRIRLAGGWYFVVHSLEEAQAEMGRWITAP
jgi:hypothetical protein